VEVSCEHSNEFSDSIKCWELLECQHNWHLLKKCSAPCVSELFFFISSNKKSFSLDSDSLYS
jgi:hypothetical protein